VSSHSLAAKYAASLGTANTEIFNGGNVCVCVCLFHSFTRSFTHTHSLANSRVLSVWALKKLSYESTFRKRFIFIDPSQGTFHW
jgi:hypothetical protein